MYEFYSIIEWMLEREILPTKVCLIGKDATHFIRTQTSSNFVANMRTCCWIIHSYFCKYSLSFDAFYGVLVNLYMNLQYSNGSNLISQFCSEASKHDPNLSYDLCVAMIQDKHILNKTLRKIKCANKLLKRTMSIEVLMMIEW